MTSEPADPTAPRSPASPAPAATAPATGRLNARGEERPSFLLKFPADPELAELVDAFEQGNFARVRSEAPRLAERTGNAAVKRAALELRRRIDPDPWLVFLLGLSCALFAFLVIWTYAH